MLPPDLLARWLNGQTVDIVAPELRLEALLAQLPAAQTLLVVVPDDGTALLAAAAVGHRPLLRSTQPEDRNRLLGRRIVVTSVDSTHAPSVRTLLVTDLRGAAVVVVGACRLDPRAPGNLGRAGFEEDLGSGRLRVHSLAATAPERSWTAPAGDGVVVRSPSPGSLLAERGGGVVLAPLPEGELVGAQRGGLPVRTHALRRPFARPWRGAMEALAASERGFDVLEDFDGAVLTGTAPVASVGPQWGGFLFGAALVLRSEEPSPESNDDALVDAVLGQVSSDAGWSVFAGDDPRLAGALADLVGIGVLGRLRPCWLTARVADAMRFRSPFADREPAWKALADRYADSLRQWSLEDRTALALSDQGPRDLVALARALGTDAAAIGDVLMDLDAGNVIAARVEARAGSWDLQVRRGRAWGMDRGLVLDGLRALRAARRSIAEGLHEALNAPGCATGAWRRAATGSAGPECGRCEVCDPNGVGWSERRAPAEPTLPSRESKAERTASLQGLFGSLAGVQAPREPAADPVALAQAGDPADLDRGVALAGGPEALYLLGLLRPQPPPGTSALPIPLPVVHVVLEALVRQASPGGLALGDLVLDGVTVRGARSGAWTVRLGPDDVTWRLVPRSTSVRWESGALDRLRERSERLVALAAARSDDAAWARAARSLEARVAQWLDANDGVPSPGQLDALAGTPPKADHPAWADAVSLWAELASVSGVAVRDRALPEGLPGREVLRVLLALRRQDDRALTAGGLLALSGDATAGSAERLLLRSLAVLDPELTAEQLLGWVARPGSTPDLGPLIRRLKAGRRTSFVELASRLDPSLRPLIVERSVALCRLPRELLDEAFAAAEGLPSVAAVLVATTPAPDRARRVWAAVRGRIPPDLHDALSAALSDIAGQSAEALATLAGAEAKARVSRQEQRAAVLAHAEAGQLGQAATLLAALDLTEASPTERDALAALRERAIARQSELVVPVVVALAGSGGPDADDAAFGAIEDAVSEGFGDALVALLVRQLRRDPEDIGRGLWLARALALNGDWREARRVYQSTARQHSDPRKRFETEFEGVFLAFDEGQSDHALRWTSELLDTPWHQVLAPHVDTLVTDEIVPLQDRAALADLLERTGSPFYSKAVGRLRA